MKYQLVIFDWEGTLMTSGRQLYPGTIDVLTALQQQGYQLAVATNRPRASLDRLLQETKLAKFFATTRCADETQFKPDPQMLQEILAELNVPSSAAVMVGDSETDMAMARHAGIDRVAVGYSAADLPALLAYQPIGYLNSTQDLLRLLA